MLPQVAASLHWAIGEDRVPSSPTYASYRTEHYHYPNNQPMNMVTLNVVK